MDKKPKNNLRHICSCMKVYNLDQNEKTARCPACNHWMRYVNIDSSEPYFFCEYCSHYEPAEGTDDFNKSVKKPSFLKKIKVC